MCTAFLICVRVAQAQDVADCNKQKNFTTKTEINFEVASPIIVMEYSQAQLGEKRESYFYQWRHSGEDSFWIADDVAMGGYFMAGLGTKIDFAVKVVPYEGQPHLRCVYIEKLRINFEYAGTTFLDNAYAAPACAAVKEQTLSFMNKRYVMAHGVVDEKQVALHNELPEIIAKLERNAVQEDAAENKVEQVKAALENASADYPEIMQAEIEERNAAIAEDSGIAGRWAVCRGQAVPSAIVPAAGTPVQSALLAGPPAP